MAHMHSSLLPTLHISVKFLAPGRIPVHHPCLLPSPQHTPPHTPTRAHSTDARQTQFSRSFLRVYCSCATLPKPVCNVQPTTNDYKASQHHRFLPLLTIGFQYGVFEFPSLSCTETVLEPPTNRSL